MRLEAFKPDDILLIKPREGFVVPDALNIIEWTRECRGLTAWEGNEAVAAAGITKWKLNHEAWVFLSDWMVQRPLVFHRLVKLHMPAYVKYMGVRELIARVAPNLKKYEQWPLALGMDFAGYDDDGNLTFRRVY